MDKNVDSIILGLKTRIFELTQNAKGYDALSYEFKKLQYENDDLKKKISQLESNYNSTKQKFNEVTIEMREEMEQLKNKIDEKQAEINNLLNEKQELDLSFNQVLKDNHEIIANLKDKQSKLKKYEVENKELEHIKNNNTKEINDLKQKLSKTNENNINSNINLQNIENQYYIIKQEYDIVKQLNSEITSKYDKLIFDFGKSKEEFISIKSLLIVEEEKSFKLNEDNTILFNKLKQQESQIENMNNILINVRDSLTEKNIHIQKLEDEKYLLLEDNSKMHNDIIYLNKQCKLLKDSNFQLCDELERVVQGDIILDRKLRNKY